MIFPWLKTGKRHRGAATPFPDTWLSYLEKNVPHYRYLTETEKAKLREDSRTLIGSKYWEGCGGLLMTDEIKVTIAAQACLLLLAIEHDYFEAIRTILVYPSAYRAEGRWRTDDGVIHEGYSDRAGQASFRGPIILSWDAALVGGRNCRDGRNVVLHEFAHQLDFLDGGVDGTPPLQNRDQFQRWCQIMTAEYRRLIENCERGEATLLDQYGATDPGEFFAVATECFFERPVEMQRRHPRLYEVLRDYYRQDTAQRFARAHH